MKTPRDLYLSQYRSATAEVESIRRHALLSTLPAGRLLWWRTVFLELYVPARPWLAGLAVAWLLILCMTLGGKRPSGAGATKAPDLAQIAEQDRLIQLALAAETSGGVQPL